jgi:hypothetical protein
MSAEQMCDPSPAPPLQSLAIRRVHRQIIVTRRTEGIEHARVLHRLHTVRNVARKIKRIASRQFVRCSIDNQSHPARQNVNDLFLRMLMLRHFAAGGEFRAHLIHCFATGQRPMFNYGANFNPRVLFLAHKIEIFRSSLS